MPDNKKEVRRYDPVGNKENRSTSQNKFIKATTINQQAKNIANKSHILSAQNNVKSNISLPEEKIVGNSSRTMSAWPEEMKLQVAKWRAERQARLAARIFKKPGQVQVPPVVLGLSTSNISLDLVDSSKKTNLDPKGNQRVVKSSAKVKGKKIEVRQTTASRLRMEKANPLLGVVSSAVLPSTSKFKTPATSSIKNVNGFKKPEAGTVQKQLFKFPKHEEKKVNNKPLSNAKTYSVKLGQKINAKPAKIFVKDLPGAKRLKNSTVESGISKLPQTPQSNTAGEQLKTKPTKIQNSNVIRSASATRFRSSQSSSVLPNNLAASVPDITKVDNEIPEHETSTLTTRNRECERASVTPRHLSMRKSRISMFSTPQVKTPMAAAFTPKPDALRRSLISWLEKRGKSLNSFNHLRCFGLHHPVTKENALNKSADGLNCKGFASNHKAMEDKKTKVASEDTFNTPAAKETKCVDESNSMLTFCSAEDLKNILSDLHKLIQAGYPRDQCEEWLYLIRKQFPNLNDEPLYWECLAALEEARGDYCSAIDFYSRAIVSGAEADSIDKSLDLLWEKFTTLSLNSKKENKEIKKQKTPRHSVDPCHVFKSSIIKFALQQRAVKQLSANLGVEPNALHYVATPVRRSTRQSSNPYKSSTVVCVGSLNTLQPDVRESVKFVANNALTPKV